MPKGSSDTVLPAERMSTFLCFAAVVLCYPPLSEAASVQELRQAELALLQSGSMPQSPSAWWSRLFAGPQAAAPQPAPPVQATASTPALTLQSPINAVPPAATGA